MLYELFTGRLPFEPTNPMEILLKHLKEAPTAPSALLGRHPARRSSSSCSAASSAAPPTGRRGRRRCSATSSGWRGERRTLRRAATAAGAGAPQGGAVPGVPERVSEAPGSDPADRVDPDWATLARIAAGDGDALALLVERHQERIVALCSRFLGDRDAAHDAAQEVFLKLWRHAGGLEPRGKLSTWLYRIAVNHCLNRLRRRRLVRFLSLTRHPLDEEAGAPAIDPASPGADPEAQLAARQRWRATRAAIDRLPAGQRAVLLLAKFEGLPYREIAATLGLTEGAVESRLVRAMRRLALARDAQVAQEIQVAQEPQEPQEPARPRVSEKGEGE